MNVSEEESRQDCSSRDLGVAAVAIGVGVGALSCFFSIHPEKPDTEGSTTVWSCQEQHTLDYITISEHTTTDTSINNTDNENSSSTLQIKLLRNSNFESESDTSCNAMDSSYEDDNDYEEESCSNDTEQETMEEYTLRDTDISNEESLEDSYHSSEEEENNSDISLTTSELGYDSSLETGDDNLRTVSSHSINNRSHESSDSEIEWETTYSADISANTRSSLSPVLRSTITINHINSPILQNERTWSLRRQVFRERQWSLELCPICIEVMLNDQHLMQLPCSHNFHVACIGPWLQEHQTCPMCRETAII